MNVNGLKQLLALTLVASTVAVAGCGGDDDNGPSVEEARTQYTSVDDKLGEIEAKLSAQLGTLSTARNEQIASTLESLSTEATDLVGQLKAVEVPDDLRDDKRTMVDAIDQGIDDLHEVVAGVKARDSDAAKAAVQDLIADSKTIGTARQQLNKALEDDSN